VALFRIKKNKLWLLKAVARESGKTIAWVTGKRDTATVQKLYAKLKHCKNATFYTDNWDAFAKVLPSQRHVIGKTHTVCIERNNSNTRHYLGRFTRKTKIVSRSEHMVYLTVKIWWYFIEGNNFPAAASQLKAMLF
jgi:insertion element IS1 protein InsB